MFCWSSELESGQIMTKKRTAFVGTISCLVLQKGKKEIPACFPASSWRLALIRTPNGKKR
jgi:hypothetical protein